jgi:hypothetical protein
MLEKESKNWYQKGAVQAAFVAGAFGILLVCLRPESTVVIVQPPQSASEPVMGSVDGTRLRQSAEVRPSSEETHRTSIEEQSPVDVVHSEPQTDRIVSEIGQPRHLIPGETWFLSNISTAITAAFRETLGSQYVEITVAPPGKTPIRFPARNAGGARQFSVENTHYEVQVLGIDWIRSKVTIIVRTVPAL